MRMPMRADVRLVLLGLLGLHAMDGTVLAADTNSAAVPIEYRRGQLMVPVRVGTNMMSFLLDTGYGMTMLRADHAAAMQLRKTGRITIVGIAGEEPADVFEGPEFHIGEKNWKSRRVAALPENPARRRRRDGILGSGFFRRFVVEIDSVAKQLTIHEPGTYQYAGKGDVLPIRFKSSTPIVTATVVLTNGSEVKTEFEVDTGCDGGLCIGKHFVDEHQLAASGRESQRQGVGGGAATRGGSLLKLRLGKVEVTNPSANFFLEGSPVDAPLAGHIGSEILRKYRVIFDYSRKQMILEQVGN